MLYDWFAAVRYSLYWPWTWRWCASWAAKVSKTNPQYRHWYLPSAVVWAATPWDLTNLFSFSSSFGVVHLSRFWGFLVEFIVWSPRNIKFKNCPVHYWGFNDFKRMCLHQYSNKKVHQIRVLFLYTKASTNTQKPLKTNSAKFRVNEKTSKTGEA